MSIFDWDNQREGWFEAYKNILDEAIKWHNAGGGLESFYKSEIEQEIKELK